MKTLLFVFAAALATATTATSTEAQAKNLYQVQVPLEFIKLLDPTAIDIWDMEISQQNRSLVNAQIYTTQQEISKLSVQDTLQDTASSSVAITIAKDAARIESEVSDDQQARQQCLARTSKNFTASSLKQLGKLVDSDYFQCFRPFHQIIEFVDAMTQVADAGVLTKLPAIGKTYEGVAMPAYKLSTGSASGGAAAKKSIYIESLIHAREFITGSTLVLFIANLLDQIQAKDQATLALLDQTDFYFLPVTNIDGYKYTWSGDRLWRKNRRIKDTKGTKTMYGVDLNRNWGPKEIFDLDHNTYLRSETYPGEFMFSESETQAINKFLDTLPNLAAVMDLHSYSGLILRPFGYKNAGADAIFDDQMEQMSVQVGNAIRQHGATSEYRVMHSFELYASYGLFADSVFLKYNNKVPAFVIEAEGDSFIVDQAEILPIGKSIGAGLVAFAKESLKYNQANNA